MRHIEWLSKRYDPKTLLAHQLMEDDVVTCHKTDSVLAAAHKIYDGNCGRVPVVDDDYALLGLVSEYDLLFLMYAEMDLWNVPVSEIMTREVFTVPENTSFLDLLHLLQKHICSASLSFLSESNGVFRLGHLIQKDRSFITFAWYSGNPC